MAVEIPVYVDIEGGINDAIKNQLPKAMKSLQSALDSEAPVANITIGNVDQANKDLKKLNDWYRKLEQDDWEKIGSTLDLSPYVNQAIMELQHLEEELNDIQELRKMEGGSGDFEFAEEYRRVNDQINATLAGIRALQGAQEQLTGSLNGSGFQQFIGSLTEANEELRQMREYYSELEDYSEKYASSINAIRGRMAELTDQWNAMTRAERESAEGAEIINKYKNERRELKEVAHTLDEIYSKEQRRQEALQKIAQKAKTEDIILNSNVKTIDILEKKERILSERLNKATIGSTKYKKLEEDLRGVRAELDKVKGGINSTTAAMEAQRPVLASLAAHAGSYFSVFALIRFAKQIRDVTGELEYQRVALGHLIQDEEYGAQMFEKIKASALESPFQIKDLITYTKQLAAYRIEQENLLDTTKRLADISAGLGVDMNRLILAYGQVRAASVLRGQELRQFTESGIPLVELLADKMGELHNTTYKTADVFKLISERAVPFSAISDIFEDLTEKGGMFYEMQKRQTETLKGQWEKLKDAFSIGLQEAGETRTFIWQNNILLNTLTVLAKNIRFVPKFIESMTFAWLAFTIATSKSTKAMRAAKIAQIELTADEMADIAATKLSEKAKKRLTNAIIMQKAATNGLSKSFWKLNAAIIANPIAGWISLATAAVSLLVFWNKKTDKQTSEFKDLADAIENVSGEMKTYARMDKQINALGRLASKTERTAKENVELARTINVLRDAFPGVALTIDDTNESLEQTIQDLRDLNEENKLNALQQAFRARTSAQDRATDLDKEIKNLLKAQGEAWDKYEFFKKEKGSEAKETKKAREEYDKIGEDVDKINKDLVQTLKYIQTLDKYLNTTADSGLAAWQQTMMRMKDFAIDGKSFNLISEGDIEGYESLYKGLKKIDQIYQDATNSAKEMKAGLSAVKDEYREAAEEEIRVEEGRRDAAKAILDTFGYISKIDQKKDNTSLAILKEELKNVQDIYKRYKEFLKYMNEGDAQKKIKEIYGGVTAIDFLSPETYKKRLADLLSELRKLQGRVSSGAKKLTAEMADDLKEMLRGDEGFQSNAYKLKGENAYTIGYGFYNKLSDGREIVEGMTMTMEEAEAELDRQVQRAAETTSNLIEKYGNGIQLTERQFNVLANLAYQGPNTLKRALKEANGDAEKLAEVLEDAAWPYVAKPHQAAVKNRDMRRALLFKLAGTASEEDAKEIASTITSLEKLVQDVDFDELEEVITKKLKKISDDIKKSETARNFYKNILDLTGDENLAENLTVSVYGGVGKDFKERIQEELYRALTEIEPENINNDLMSQIMGDITIFDIDDISKNLDKLPPKVREVFEKALEDNQKFNADWLVDFEKTYAKAASYGARVARLEKQRKQKEEEARQMGKSPEEVARVNEYYNQKIADVQLEAMKDTYTWTKAFEDLGGVSSMTLDNLIRLIDEYISKYGKDLEPQQLKELTRAREQARAQKIERNGFVGIVDAIAKLASKRKDINMLEKSGIKTEEAITMVADGESKAILQLAESYEELMSEMNGYMSSAKDLINVFASDEDASFFGGLLDNLSQAMGGVGKAGAGILGIIQNPANMQAWMQALTGLADIVAGIFSGISAAKLREINKQIEAQQKKIEALDRSYQRLEKAMAKAFGSDYIYNYNQQLDNLQAKVDAYNKQADLESSKGKKADKEKVEEYKQSAEAAAEEIADMKGQLAEFFTGTDVTSAAKDFANSWIEAYKEFGSTTSAMKEKFQDLIQSMVEQSIGAKIMQSILQPLFDSIDKMAKEGGELSAQEIAQIAQSTPEYIDKINNAMTNMMNQLTAAGYNMRQGVGQFTGISRDIAGASEESITGLAAGINTQNFYMSLISQNVAAILATLTGGAEVTGAAGAAAPEDPYKEQMLQFAGVLPRVDENIQQIYNLLKAAIVSPTATPTKYVHSMTH